MLICNHIINLNRIRHIDNFKRITFETTSTHIFTNQAVKVFFDKTQSLISIVTNKNHDQPYIIFLPNEILPENFIIIINKIINKIDVFFASLFSQKWCNHISSVLYESVLEKERENVRQVLFSQNSLPKKLIRKELLITLKDNPCPYEQI